MTGIESAIAATVIKSASGPATNALTSWGRTKYDKFVVNYTKAFSENVQKSIDKCKIVRNVLYRNQYASTDEKYVSISFKNRKEKEISDEAIQSDLIQRKKILIRGRGGAGKTMFTKWSVLRSAESFDNHQQIPIYIELREIKDQDNSPFEKIVFDHISTTRSHNSLAQFLEAIKIGLFTFVFDAADEINKNDRSSICRKIEKFIETYPECGVLLTSRDFTEIDSLGGFEHYFTRSLKKSEAVAILDKLDYEESVKSALMNEINSEKTAQRHAFFLENPLMVTIMLLTYDQSKDIPTKRSAFYRRAFEALYERHDSSKGIFRRDHHAGLPMDEFESVFSAFCFGTYINGKFNIPDTELVPLFRESCRIAGIDEDAEAIAKDAYESACLLVKEGHDFVFCHRSFQEYFVASYIRDYRGDEISEMFDLALSRGQGENVIEFIYEMDKYSFEVNYVIPKLRKLVSSMSKSMKNNKDYLSLVSCLLKSISFRSEDLEFYSWDFQKEVDVRFLFNISSVYPSVNLVDVFIDFSTSSLSFRKLPVDIAKKTRSVSIKKAASGEEIYEARFTPSAISWFDQSEMREKVEEFWKSLQQLLQSLDASYSDKDDEARQIFARFSKN